MTSLYDVVIVGASLAGSSLSQQLSRLGYSVLLIDKETFPRRKPCGEGLSTCSIPYLKALGLYDLVFNREANVLKGFEICRSASATPHRLSNDLGMAALAVQRKKLDHLLVQHAIASGTEARFGDRAYRARRLGEKFEVELGGEVLYSKFLVLAEGLNGALSNQLSTLSSTSNIRRYGITAYANWQGERIATSVRIILNRGFETYITPISATELNISFLGDKLPLQRLLQNDQLAREVRRVLTSMGGAGELISEPLGSGPFSSQRRSASVSNLFLIGDSAEVFDPIGGMGMSHAFLSASLAAEHTQQALLRAGDSERICIDYERARISSANPLRGYTSLIFNLLRRTGRTPLFPLLCKLPMAQQLPKYWNESARGYPLRAVVERLGRTAVG